MLRCADTLCEMQFSTHMTSVCKNTRFKTKVKIRKNVHLAIMLVRRSLTRSGRIRLGDDDVSWRCEPWCRRLERSVSFLCAVRPRLGLPRPALRLVMWLSHVVRARRRHVLKQELVVSSMGENVNSFLYLNNFVNPDKYYVYSFVYSERLL